ncbi:GNAT family N-acetyltransferase [Calidifontibacillus oryziterrae]|uniref:GNAT family N-acetyltransferase n=1 Tax=Calidifontibacillus oryziterrae TaxID=1191699 RepID=UPI000557352C|nr:GNAT family N-acetyltransferase [Calidifontibacillus oryziterrae]
MSYKIIEELSMNNWQSLSTLFYDGWVLRLAKGYTIYANSINPLYFSTYNLDDKINDCEKIYTNNGLTPTFKITPFVQPENLDKIIEQKGYSLVDFDGTSFVSVQTMNLVGTIEPTLHSVNITKNLNSEWLDYFCRFNNVEEEHKPTIVQMLSTIATKKCFLSLYHQDKVVACGLGVIEREYIGLYDIVTDSQYRNQGFGKQLVMNLLKWGKANGAKYSYLTVLSNNDPALKLYTNIGFSEVYQYWYRVKKSFIN